MEGDKTFDVKQCSVGAAVLYAIGENNVTVWRDVLSRPDFPRDLLVELLTELGSGKLISCIFKESGTDLIALMSNYKISIDSILSIFAYLYPDDDAKWQQALDDRRVYNYFCELSETALIEKYSVVTSAVFARQMYLMHPVL